MAAFTALQATASPPPAAKTDQICSAVLWARFAPAGAPRGGCHDLSGTGQPAGG